MIQKPEAGKMEGNDMPEGSSTEGMDANSGASQADVKKGFTSITDEQSSEYDFEMPTNGGFVGRASGWER